MDTNNNILTNTTRTAHKIIRAQTQEFFQKQIAATTVGILKNTTTYIKNSFCVTLSYATEYDDVIEKSLIEILTRISKKTLDYCTNDKSFKKNKTFFLRIKNHKSIIKVETPTFDTLHRNMIIITIIGIDALLVTAKFNNTFKSIKFNKKEIGINTMYSEQEANGTLKWKVSYKSITAKGMNEVFTDTDTKMLLNHIKKWTKASYFYQKVNIIHKTGILLYGPPGTGKTTLAKAIAKEIEADVYVVNMGDFNDSQIKRIKEDIEHLSDAEYNVLIFEDIDCIFSNRDNLKTDNKQQAAQLLLQFLDGVFSIPNVISIATTNHIETLDDALIRDGRFDLKVEMNNISQDTAQRMCKYFGLSQETSNNLLQGENFPINPAYLQNKIVKYVISIEKDDNNVSA